MPVNEAFRGFLGRFKGFLRAFEGGSGVGDPRVGGLVGSRVSEGVGPRV